MISVKVKKLHPEAKLPTYATDGSGCFDLASFGAGELWRGEPVCVFRTGLAFEIPDGHVMLIFSRSGHGFNYSTRLANCVGVIDSDYRGEVMVKLRMDSGNEILSFKPGDRIAQAIVIPFPRAEFIDVDALSETARGEGGFGSTDAKRAE